MDLTVNLVGFLTGYVAAAVTMTGIVIIFGSDSLPKTLRTATEVATRLLSLVNEVVEDQMSKKRKINKDYDTIIPEKQRRVIKERDKSGKA